MCLPLFCRDAATARRARSALAALSGKSASQPAAAALRQDTKKGKGGRQRMECSDARLEELKAEFELHREGLGDPFTQVSVRRSAPRCTCMHVCRPPPFPQPGRRHDELRHVHTVCELHRTRLPL